jgi:hypothetical protein
MSTSGTFEELPVTRIFAATLVALALAAHEVPAQSKPNFSGSWKMNASKSDFGAIPAPASIERKITHAEPSLIIVEAQDAGLGVETVTRTYTTGGKGTTFISQGAEVKGTAVWEGNELVVTSEVEVAMIKFIDRMILAPDGKTLMSVIKLTSPAGDVDIKALFEKQ